jgi:hypothetical protein
MRAFRQMEAIAGVGATIMGLLTLAVALFVPLLSFRVITTTPDGQATAHTEMQTLAQQVSGGTQTSLLVTFAALAVSMGLLALTHTRRRTRGDLILLWIVCLLLLAEAYFSIVLIMGVFVPTALLALICAISGTLAQASAGAAES